VIKASSLLDRSASSRLALDGVAFDTQGRSSVSHVKPVAVEHWLLNVGIELTDQRSGNLVRPTSMEWVSTGLASCALDPVSSFSGCAA
jgi:hypothetical protein